MELADKALKNSVVSVPQVPKNVEENTENMRKVTETIKAESVLTPGTSSCHCGLGHLSEVPHSIRAILRIHTAAS